MTEQPKITECPECGHMARWDKDHWHCGWCGEDIWPEPPKEKP